MLCLCLVASQAANAFFCFRSGSSGKSFIRPAPYPGPPHAATVDRLPPIMPLQPLQKIRPQPRAPRPLIWRPLDYRTGSL